MSPPKWFLLLFLTFPLLGAEPLAQGQTFYRWSLASIVASSAADSVSSWHKSEANPVLGPQFDARSLAIKSALIGGSLLIEHFAIQHNLRLYRAFGWLNLGVSVGLGAVAVHNTRVH